MAADNKSIGRLTLDISNVETQVKKVHELLKSIGVGVKIDLSKQVASEVKKQLDAVQKEIENGTKKISDAAQKAAEAINQIGNAKVQSKESALLDKLEQRVLKFENKMQAEVDKTLAKMEANAQKEAAAVEKAEERKRAAREKEEKRYQQVWDKISYLQREDKRVAEIKAEQEAMANLINMYKQYYEMESNKIKAVNNGDIENADIYRSRAQGIWEEISAIEAANPKLAEMAGKTEEVTAAVQKWQAAANAGQMKSDSIINKQELENTKQALDELIQKYVEYYNLESQKINATHKGDTESADIYRERAKNIWEVIAAIEAANPKLAEMAAENDKVNEAMQRWQMTAKQGEMNADKALGLQSIADAKQKYFELTDAIKNYQAASKQGNQEEMAMWSQKISSIMQEVGSIQQAVQASNMEAGVKQQILNIIQQCNTAQNQYNATQAQSVTQTSELESQMTGLLTRMFSIMAVIRAINNLINNTVEYVSEYYDKMNEIQIITQKSNEEVAQLGETYRDIAEQMNVSSLDMADAAIYFTRQGLGAAEIEERLKNVTMYAKTANVEFTEAAEIITSVVNSMGLVEQEAEDGRNAAQRVADVFLLVGDNAATSGQEIGSAMQKAAAAAGSFGLSMEWLASYIATVSETTRQEARTIGTALNTIIARLHSIRTTGYNADDDTKINDIAKALNTVNIQLMDQEGNWRDMEDIFQDVAGVWDTLTGKQKSYIATTMAGVKQQNVFLALMKDMAKGVEGGSRAYELYNLAINSAGTAEQKYATYKDSVAASQERLNVAQEKFYSLLDANVIKNWNNIWASFINGITEGVKQFGSLTLILPVAIGLMTTFGIVMKSAAFESGVFATIWESHPVLVAIAAGATVIMALVSAISAWNNEMKTQEERFNEASEAMDKSNSRIVDMTKAQKDLNQMTEELGDKTSLTSDDLAKYNDLLDSIASLSPECKEAVEGLRDGMISQQDAAGKLNEEIERLIANEKEYRAVMLARKYDSWTPKEVMQETDAFMKRMEEWDKSWAGGETGLKGFANSLQAIWNNTKNPRDSKKQISGRQYWYTNDVYKKIYDYIDTYGDSEKGWEHIAQIIWQETIGDDSYSLGETLKSYADEAINEAVSVLGSDMNAPEKGLLRQILFNYIGGNDGEISLEEYNNLGKKMKDFIISFLDEFSGDLMSIDPEASMNYIGENLFGKFFSMMFNPEDIKEAAHDSEFMNAVIDAYSELLDAGFTDQQIASILKGKSLFDWDKMADMMADDLKDSLKEKFGVNFLGEIFEDLDTGEIKEDSMMWDLLDASVLKVISDLADTGVSIYEINALMGESESLEDFTARLKELGNTLGVEIPEGAEEAKKSLSDYVGEIKNAKTEVSNIDKLYKKGKENGALTLEDVLGSGLADKHADLLLLVNDFGALMKRIQELKDESINNLSDSVAGIILNSKDEAKRSPFADRIEDAGLETIQEYRDMLEMAGDDFSEVDQYVENSANKIKEAAQSTEEAAETWLEAQEKIIRANEELNWAKSTNFAEQIGTMENLMSDDTIEGLASARDYFNGLNEEMRKAIADEYPGLIEAINEADKMLKSEDRSTEAVTKAQNRLNSEFKKIGQYNTAKAFTDTFDAIQKLEKGTISATGAYEVFNKEINNVTKAQEDINDVTNKMADGAEIAETDVSNLAKVLGLSADQILQNFPEAVDLFNELIGESGELRAAFDALNEAAFIRITGTSVADFSELQNGLISVQNLAEKTIELLQATGQWETQTITLPQEAFIWDPLTETWIRQTIEAGATVLKATGKNPYSGTSSTGRSSTGSGKGKGKSGGGGGGGGGSSDKGMTEVERALDRMSQVHAIQEYQQSYYQSQGANFEQNGYLQGVIDANQKEIAVLEDQNKTLEENIKTIEKYREQKEKELEATSMTDEKYEEIAGDLDKLQKAHQSYTKELIDNKTAIDKLNEAIDEQRKKIRDMQIKLRETIYKAIEDREKKAQSMLQNEITMENTILDIIKRKYEIERDKILENTDARIESLTQERDLLSEQLQLRKEMADKEDKSAKLASLEANYQRILADPTRMKEAQSILKQITDLREEIAWDAAEDEVKAQQESIDQQITSLDDYKQYIEDYYTDLLEHPQKLIEEMKEIITGTDEEILNWLKENSEEFANSTENTQTQMIETWQKTLDDMHGKVSTYWDEVEEIIAGGDKAIIDFLKENSDEYAKAGELQAEKYVEEWKKQLDDLHKALAEAFTIDPSGYSVIDQGGGGRSGGGGGGGGRSSSATESVKEDHGYSFVYGGNTYARQGYSSRDAAESAMKERVKKEVGGTSGSGSSYIGEAIRMIQKQATVYKKGGIADFTGPAWLDGSPSDPERVLSPYQTRLFETMVKALEKISTINIPTMPNFGSMQTGSGNAVSVGDIIVNVDNLDTDDDYEELANKVSEVLMERIGKTAVIGGLRIG